jgi:hypothetical protein
MLVQDEKQNNQADNSIIDNNQITIGLFFLLFSGGPGMKIIKYLMVIAMV